MCRAKIWTRCGCFWTSPARQRGHSGAVPPQTTACASPNENCVPPNGELCLKEFIWLGATGVQLETWDSQNTAYHFRIRGNLYIFGEETQNSWKFAYFLRWWSFFFGLCLRFYGNLRSFCDEDKNSWAFAYFLWWRPFFWSLAQISWNFAGPHFRIQTNKVLVPPPNLFMPIQSRYSGAGPAYECFMQIELED